MLRGDGYVKLLDFGLAKLITRHHKLRDETLSLQASTQTGVVLGTVSYMSPEQTRGQAVDTRTDIFSLGVVLYEMVAGCVPFPGATNADVMVSILQNQPPALVRFAAGLPDELERITNKTLSKDPEQRYQTAKELLSDLQSLKRRMEFEEELKQSVSTGAAEVSARRPETRYAKSGDVNIAYQSVGHGAIDLVYVMGWSQILIISGRNRLTRDS
jgi:serine/threonine protein kinase